MDFELCKKNHLVPETERATELSLQSEEKITWLHFTSFLLQESPEANYRVRRIVGVTGTAYSRLMKVALNFPTFRAGAGAK
jgi:hypothetical protein